MVKRTFCSRHKRGYCIYLFSGWKIQQTFIYNSGKKEGLSKEFDKEGKIITLLEYSNDFLVSREKINRQTIMD
jgi:antitoxin component YwqK of YwqJK toxin-antitoxin module